MKRLSNWQNALSLYLAKVARTPFQPGTMDCALFAAGAVEAQTGIALQLPWAGRYTTLEEGLQHLADEGFEDHIALVASLLVEIPVAEAEAGDIAAVPLGRNLPSLGVVQGTGVYVPVEDHIGFVTLPLSEVTRAFRVPR